MRTMEKPKTQKERNAVLVTGLTMKDIIECHRLAVADSLDKKDNTIDTDAVCQNLLCHIERKMRIFPNIDINYSIKNQHKKLKNTTKQKT